MKPILPHIISLLLVAPLAAVHAADAPAIASSGTPNIVVILADDLGYGDVQCYNPQRGKVPTPHIDRLASQGVRFTDAHSSSAVCSPSRYTLLTGRYHWRTRLQNGIVGVFGEPLIAPDRMTIGTLARQHGYRTAAIGKWHLGWDWPIPEGKRKLFTKLGGKAGGGGGDIVTTVTDAHRAAWREVFSQPIPGGPTTRGFDEYFGTDIPNWPPYCFIGNDRTQGIPSELLPKEQLRKNQASLQGPALPGWTFEPILPTLGDRACDFISRQAGAKKPFLLFLPLTSPHTPLAVNEAWRGKSGLDNAAADLIMETDDVVGRVLRTLESSGVAGETLVLFTSDNGFAPYVGAADLQKRGHFPSGPLRGYKFDAWEGGHREPFIIRWPGVVKPGGVCDQLVHHADILRTLADILGAKLPDNAGEDSFSLLPLLKGGDTPIRPHAVSCAGSGTPGVRRGHWKLIPGKHPELYNLADDIGETRNLAGDKPGLVAEMQALLEKLITDGRSTPGVNQKNDTEVRRFPDKATPSGEASGNTGQPDNAGYDKPMAPRPGYRLVEDLSDEFNGNALDGNKWVDHMTYWNGRGAEFLPSNVAVGDGCLKLRSSVKDEAALKELYTIIDTALTGASGNIDVNTWSPAGYGGKWDAKVLSEGAVFDKLMQAGMKSIGAAAVMSRNRIAGKGYYEARIKASNISMSTAFWLQGGGSEFDITESYGNYTVDMNSPWHTNKPYQIALSTWWNDAPAGTPAFKTIEFHAPEKLSAKFFVLGFLWGETEVKVYYNDKEILCRDLRGVPEIDCKVFASLKHLIFDTEILLGPWFGWPTKSQLTDPKNNTYSVDWVRVWEPVAP